MVCLQCKSCMIHARAPQKWSISLAVLCPATFTFTFLLSLRSSSFTDGAGQGGMVVRRMCGEGESRDNWLTEVHLEGWRPLNCHVCRLYNSLLHHHVAFHKLCTRSDNVNHTDSEVLSSQQSHNTAVFPQF